MKRTKAGKLLCLGMAAMLVFQTVPQMTVQAEETEVTEQVYVGDFNLYQYRADVYLKEDTVCNRAIQNMMTTTLPSQLIVNQLDKKSTFQNTVNVWKALHYATSPSEIAEGAIDEQGYYTAIILSVFKAETSNNRYIEDCVKKVNSDTNKILSNMKKWVQESEQLEESVISKKKTLAMLSNNDKSLIKAYLEDEFKKNHPVLKKSSTITSDLAAIFDAVSTLGEAVELMESYIQISEMSAGMKAVLMEMYNQCPDSNETMKVALYEAALSSESLSGALDATILNTTGKEVAEVLGVLIDAGWESIIESSPYAKAFMTGAKVGTWLGDTVCNTLFSTDKTIEQYQKMKCLSEFTALLKSTVTEMGNTYMSDKSVESAKAYFSAIDALYSVGYLSCDFAENYGDILYEDTTLGWITISKANYEEYISSVQAIKKYYESDQESLTNNYLAELEYDYPEIYAILMGTEEQETVAVTGIEFGYDEVTIGLEDPYTVGIKLPVVQPSNATNQKVTYTSSDTTILEISPLTGWCDAKAEGTASVTATTTDGNFTDTVTVKVVAGRSEVWDVISGYQIVDYGICGENIAWTLYSNGTMIIEGEGEIKQEKKWENMDIKRVKILEGITGIGADAFEYCSSLKYIEIPSGVTSIGRCAFYGCSSLANIEIPSGVTSIGWDAFYGCSSLTSLEIPSGVTSIEWGTFGHCSSLTSIEIPTGVTSIGEYAFRDCSSLTSLEVPSRVMSIGRNAFEGCSSLTSLEIPSRVTSIEWCTFQGCSSLRSLEIPSKVTSIGALAFDGCSSLTNIEIPPRVTNIEGYVFSGCNSLTNIEIPSGVTSIEEGAFQGCSSLTSIKIPKGVTNIGKKAFYDCSGLTSIAISEGVTNIGDGAFDGCNNLVLMCVKDSCVHIYAMENNIPYRLNGFYIVAFGINGGDELKQNRRDVKAGEGIGELPIATRNGYTFKGWFTQKSGGRKVTATTIVSADMMIYAQWEAVEQSIEKAVVTLSTDSVTYNGFPQKPTIKSVKLKVGNTTKTLKKDTDYTVSYKNNTNIGTATVTITGKGNYTGAVTTTFKITVKKGTTFTAGSNKYKITGSSEVAFAGLKNTKTTKVTIPKTVKYGGKSFKIIAVADKALYKKAKVTSVSIGSNVKTIGKEAFQGCSKLSNITIKSTKLKSVGKNALKGIKATAKIKVPAKKLTAYKKLLKGKGQGKKVKVVK